MEPKEKTKLTIKQLLSKLKKDELVDGYPTCKGLKRLVETYIGNILTNTVEVEYVSTSDSPYPIAVVTTRISIVIDDCTKSYSDVADCGMYNTEEPYCLHPTATAATRSEARVYRKIIGLSKASYEEVGLKKRSDEPELQDTVTVQQKQCDEPQIEMATKTQKRAITIVCQRNSIDLSATLQNLCGVSDVENLSKTQADMVLSNINEVKL